MAGKAKKYLVDTSAVRALLQWSTEEHSEQTASRLADGEIWASAYIRKEYIGRWICDMILSAVVIYQCSDVADALCKLEQQFGSRKPKSVLAWIQKYLRKTGALQNSNTRAVAEDVASLAVQALDEFDEVYHKLIDNRCGCQIGCAQLKVDYDHLLRTTHQFRETFQVPVLDCKVNAFLQMKQPKGKLKPLIEDPKAAKLTAVKRIQKLRGSSTHITCIECAGIGDVVIALEQPASHCMVHVDHSYNDLCRCLGRKNMEVQSVIAVDNELHTGDELEFP